jgi:hypothetical protein
MITQLNELILFTKSPVKNSVNLPGRLLCAKLALKLVNYR